MGWQQLGAAVIRQALRDGDLGDPEARFWLQSGDRDLRRWCATAGLDMVRVVRTCRQRWPRKG